MKLTVAMRIVGGFSAILILLLFLGGTSYYSLSGISDSTNQVNSISIPALENSATLQSEFVKMSKIILQAYYSEEVKDVVNLEGQFGVEKSQYDTAAKALQAVVAHCQTGERECLAQREQAQYQQDRVVVALAGGDQLARQLRGLGALRACARPVIGQRHDHAGTAEDRQCDEQDQAVAADARHGASLRACRCIRAG